MQITNIKVWKEDLALSRPYTIAYRTIDHVENIFVYLGMSNGQYGLGAGSPAVFVTGESIDAGMAALEAQVHELLHNRSILEFNSLLRTIRQQMPGLPAARAALDIALHDLLTKYLNLRLVDWLGQVHAGLPTSVTIGIKSVEETLEEARDYVGQGFRILKLKTGHSAEQDIEVFSRLRETVGSEIKIRVDVNQGYAPAHLLHFVRSADALDVELLEQPFPANQLNWAQEIPDTIRRRFAADEDLHGADDAIQLAARPQPYGIFNIKLMKCGGVAEARRIADIAERSGIELMWGCNDESVVSITAALHVALASPATRYLDLDGSFDLAGDLVEGGFVLRDGCLYPGDGPGLGVRLLGQV